MNLLTKTAPVAIASGTAAAVAFAFAASPAQAAVFNFSNPAAITIPASGTSGPASPYPSTISVSGITEEVTKVTVMVSDLSHTASSDIQMLLVGPLGQTVYLMGFASNGFLNNVTLTFEDGAPALPFFGAIPSGTYAPTTFSPSYNFPAPAPARPYGSVLSAFNGLDPNGTWNLFVADTASADIGSISGGWKVTLETADAPAATPEPSAVLGLGLLSLGAFCKRKLSQKQDSDKA